MPLAILFGILIGVFWDRIKIVLAVFILLIGAWLYPLAAVLVGVGLLAVQVLIVVIRRRSITPPVPIHPRYKKEQ